MVDMTTSLEISEKEVQINHLHPKRFHLVKRLRKSVQQILRKSFTKRSLKRDTKNKKITKLITQAKYIALPASLPSRLN